MSGADARKKVDEELEMARIRSEMRKSEMNQPFRFYVPVGEEKDAIILDDAPDFFLYEHTIRNPRTGKWGTHLVCVKEHDSCPVCEQMGESVWTMFLSVIDLTPYVDKKGNEIPWSRKLLAIKPSQQKKFIRRWEQQGTLRGAVFKFIRDGEKDAAIGNDIEYIETASDEELAEDFIKEWVDKDGKQHTEDHGQPIDYASVFVENTAEELRKLVGGSPPPGSREQVDRDLGTRSGRRGGRDTPKQDKDKDWEADGSDAPWDDEPAAAERPARTARTTRVAAAEEPKASSTRTRRTPAAAEPVPEQEPVRRPRVVTRR